MKRYISQSLCQEGRNKEHGGFQVSLTYSSKRKCGGQQQDMLSFSALAVIVSACVDVSIVNLDTVYKKVLLNRWHMVVVLVIP